MIFKIKLPILSDLFGLDTDDGRPDDIAKPRELMAKMDNCVCVCLRVDRDTLMMARWDDHS